MSVVTEVASDVAVVPRSRVRHEVVPLYLRMLRNVLRVPSTLVPSLFIPVFFLTVNTAALGGIVDLPVFATDDYVAFFLPVAVMMTVASAGNGSGMSLVADIGTGYFDKLLLSPISRTSILLSRLMVDGTRAALQTVLVFGIGLALGAQIVTGFFGALIAVGLAFLFGLAFAGIGLTIALRTGNAEATQASMIIFFPLVFLAPTFVPLDFLPDWLAAVARLNPMTYVIEGMRGLLITGYVWRDVLEGLAAIVAIGAVTLTAAFWALRARATR